MRNLLFLLSIFSGYFTSAQLSDSTYASLYKNSNSIFTGVLKSKYQLPSYTECSDEIRMLLEFDLTEIQKGKRHMKILIEANDSTLKINHEYLVFCNKKKIRDEKKINILHYEEVCLNCPNPGIKAIYNIIYKGLFRTIKEPLTPGNLAPKGCGCHNLN
jgi:hypothetical protein